MNAAAPTATEITENIPLGIASVKRGSITSIPESNPARIMSLIDHALSRISRQLVVSCSTW